MNGLVHLVDVCMNNGVLSVILDRILFSMGVLHCFCIVPAKGLGFCYMNGLVHLVNVCVCVER
jgi:hypothetical protein